MDWRSSDEQFCRAEGGASDKPMASANAHGSAHWYLSSFVADVMGSMVCCQDGIPIYVPTDESSDYICSLEHAGQQPSCKTPQLAHGT